MATGVAVQEEKQDLAPIRVAHPLHTAVLVLVLFASAYFSAMRIARHPPSPSESHIPRYLQVIVTQWVLVGYIALAVHRSGFGFKRLIGGRWNSPDQILLDLAIAAGFWLASIGVLALLRWMMGLLNTSQLDVIKRTMGFLAPHGWREISMWILLCVSVGFCEELIFRGYLQKQFSYLAGSGVAGIILSAAVFGGVHIYQGGAQMLVLGVYGAMFGTLAFFRKSLRPGMIVHAWQDTIAGLLLSLLTK